LNACKTFLYKLACPFHSVELDLCREIMNSRSILVSLSTLLLEN